MAQWIKDITDGTEIYSQLIEALDETFPLIMWQTTEGKRTYVSGYIKEIKDGTCSMGLIQDDKRPIKIQSNVALNVNFTGYYAAFHFVAQVKYVSSSHVIIKLPDRLRVHLFNRQAKYVYEQNEHNLMTYKLAGQRLSNTVFKVMLMQVAPHKVIFYSDDMGADTLRVGDEISVLSISEHNVSEQQMARIRSVVFFDPEKKGGRRRPCRVGATLFPFLVDMKSLPLFREKKEELFGLEEIAHIKQKQKEMAEVSVEELIRSQNYMVVNENNAMEEYSPGGDGYFYGYSENEQANVLREISLRDEKLAIQLKANNNYLKNLEQLNVEQKEELMKSIDVATLAASFRLSTKKTINLFLDGLSLNVRSQLLCSLREQKMATAVLKAQKELVRCVRFKESEGRFVFKGES